MSNKCPCNICTGRDTDVYKNTGFVFGNSPEIRPLPPSRSICEFCNMTASDIFKKGFEAAMEQLKKEQK